MTRSPLVVLAALALAVVSACSSSPEPPASSAAPTSHAASASSTATSVDFRAALESSDIAAVDAALAEGADPSEEFSLGGNPLAIAVSRDSAEVAQLLIDAGADVTALNASGQNALHIAAANGASADIVHLLLDANVSVEVFDTTQYDAAPMHVAAREGSLDVLAALIAAGEDVNLANERWGATPVFFAGAGAQPEAAQLLIDAGANLDHQELDGETPLESAQGYGADAVVEVIEAALAE